MPMLMNFVNKKIGTFKEILVLHPGKLIELCKYLCKIAAKFRKNVGCLLRYRCPLFMKNQSKKNLMLHSLQLSY